MEPSRAAGSDWCSVGNLPGLYLGDLVDSLHSSGVFCHWDAESTGKDEITRVTNLPQSHINIQTVRISHVTSHGCLLAIFKTLGTCLHWRESSSLFAQWANLTEPEVLIIYEPHCNQRPLSCHCQCSFPTTNDWSSQRPASSDSCALVPSVASLTRASWPRWTGQHLRWPRWRHRRRVMTTTSAWSLW